MAQPFDAGSRQLSAEPFPVAEGVASATVNGRAAVTVSESGVLAYRSGSGGAGVPQQIAWFDRAGKRLEPVGAPAVYGSMRLSPDGNRLAVTILDQLNSIDIWIIELARGGVPSRVTFAPEQINANPVWSPDGSQIVFSASPGSTFDLYRKASSGIGEAEVLLKSPLNKRSTSWTPDGRFIVYGVTDPKTKSDIWILPLLDDRKTAAPFLQTPFYEDTARISPDGRWIAYVSDESGGIDVYVRPFPAGDRKWRISIGGGDGPQWRDDGKELFYMDQRDNLMAVDINAGATFGVGVPKTLFQARLSPRGFSGPLRYAVGANGQRFLISVPTEARLSGSAPIIVVMNWVASVKR